MLVEEVDVQDVPYLGELGQVEEGEEGSDWGRQSMHEQANSVIGKVL